MKGAEPWSLCSLITVLIMLPGNNMHFIFFPSLCLYHLHPIPPLSPIPSPFHLFCLSPCFCFCLFLFVIYSISYFLSCAILFSLSEFLIIIILFFLDFQSCLICVARRVPTKERPMLPTHESFTTRQDLQGTRTSQPAVNYKPLFTEKFALDFFFIASLF